MRNLLLATSALLAVSASALQAQIIISDNFNGLGTHSTIAGTSGQTDLPAVSWNVSRDFSTSSGQFYAWSGTTGFSGGQLTSTQESNSVFVWDATDVNGYTDGPGAATVSLASAGAYVKPAILTLSLDVYANDFASNANEGLLVGYWSSQPTNTSNSLTNFFGFLVNSSGQLALVQNGVVGPEVNYTGTFTSSQFNTLTYTVTTTTGGISGVSYGGNTNYSFSSTAFTSAATSYAGFGVSSPNNNSYGYVDNFSVTGSAAVPEPSTWALLFGGLGALFFFGKRRASRL